MNCHPKQHEHVPSRHLHTVTSSHRQNEAHPAPPTLVQGPQSALRGGEYRKGKRQRQLGHFIHGEVSKRLSFRIQRVRRGAGWNAPVENCDIFNLVAVWIDIPKVAPTKYTDDCLRIDEQAGFFTDLTTDCLLR